MALMLSCVSLFGSSCFSPASASLDRRIPRAATTEIASPQSLCLEETKGRITKLFEKNEVCISTYDTAWVAMVPSPSSSREPCFPDSLSWLLENQCDDGSWARPHHHSLLKKDVLSSTLASILALQKWGIGEQNINRGLRFMELNSASAIDSSQITPMGFDIIFPAMIDCANNLSLNLHFDSTTINHLMNKRDLEIQRCYKSWSAETEAYLAYIGEGMGKLHKWESVISKYQRKNGSLFNSPSTTAAAFIALGNSDCLNYLNTTLKTFRSAVPAVYPLDIYSQLCLVDNLEKLGISRFFLTEIQTVLDETYRRWLDRDEEIFMDASTCAMAFRILRMNGYNVAADSFTEILQKFSCSGHIRDINKTLELYKASQVMLYPHETQLEKQNLRLRSLLQQELSCGSIQTSQLNAEVKQALEAPFYAVFSRAAMRRTVEQYNCEGIRIQKTSYCSPNFGNKDLLSLAVHDFNHCQTIHCTEFRNLYRWFVENRLDEVEYSRPIKAFLAYSYVSAAATIFAPELSDSRMSWAKNAIMVGVVDDLFDVIGSNEEKKMLIQLFELWDVDFSTKCCSHKVKVIFLTIKSLIEEVGDKASRVQGRNVKRHIISIWQDLLNSMMKEEERREEKVVPTIDEYINTAYVSFALGPVILPALYLVGPKLSEEIVNHPEYHTLYKLMSVCGRLLNDVHGYKRECKDGKHNTLSLYMMNNEGDTTKEAAISEIKSWIDVERRELLRIVLKKSVIPKSCKYFFWQMCALMHPFYNYPFDNYDDTRSFKELLTQCVSLVIDQPIILHKDL